MQEALGKGKKLSRAIADAGWRQFLTYLKYKAYEAGKYFLEVGKYFPSSQLCSRCGHQQKMELKDREFYCQECHVQIDRDYNSSIVIKAAGSVGLKCLWSYRRVVLKQESFAFRRGRFNH